MKHESLEQRLERLEALEDIRRLMYRYARVSDSGFDPAQMAELWATNSVWESANYGKFVGRTAIVAFLTESAKRMSSYSAHYVINADIAVESGQGQGKMLLLMPATVPDGDGLPTPYWMFGQYEVEVIRQDGAWRLQRVRVLVDKLFPHRAGWV